MSKSKISLSDLSAPIIAIFFSSLANGLLNTLVSLRLAELSFGEWVIGLVCSGYYIGIVFGSISCAKLINRIGHIRAFAAFATFCAISTLVLGIFVNPYIWFFIRIVSGTAIAGTWIAAESWILNKSSPTTRGKYMSLYMLSVYLAISLGQLLLKISYEAFIYDFVVISLFFSISAIPITITASAAPIIEKPKVIPLTNFLKIHPSGIYGCFYAGIVLGAIYSIFPYYFFVQNFTQEEIGIIMFSTILGGTFLQIPVGYFSDNFDRRKVLFVLASLATIISSIIIVMPKDLWNFVVFGFFLGGIIFSIYPVSMSHVSDSLSKDKKVSIIHGLVVVYGVGNIVGPLITPGFMSFFGAPGLFIFFVIIGILFLSFLTARIIKRSRRMESNA
jgi:MFS family permease